MVFGNRIINIFCNSLEDTDNIERKKRSSSVCPSTQPFAYQNGLTCCSLDADEMEILTYLSSSSCKNCSGEYCENFPSN